MLSSQCWLVPVLAVTAYAQTTTLLRPRADTATITGFLASGLAADVVTANACSTIVALDCDQWAEGEGPLACDTNESATFTLRTTGYEVSYLSTTGDITVSGTVNCNYKGASSTYTAEICTNAISGVSAGSSGTTTVTSTTTLASLTPYQILITAGAFNLPSGSQSCTIKPNAAAPPAIVEVYEVLVPMGAALAADAVFL